MFSKHVNLKLEKEFEDQRVEMLAATKKMLDMYQNAVASTKDLFTMVSKFKKDEEYYPFLTTEQQKNFEKNYQYFEKTINKQLEILNYLENNYTQQTRLRSNKKEELFNLCDKFKPKMDEAYQIFKESEEAHNFFMQVLGDRAKKYMEELKKLIESPDAKAELAQAKTAFSR